MDTTFSALAVFVLAIAVLASSLDRRTKPLERRMARLEEKVDLLMAHLGVEVAEDPRMAEVDALLAQGKKIQAIKVYREVTGEGLAEAKEAVERRMR
ncbi:ribosomal protein L7/L12 [Streptomyces sp. RS10V-4]|uniref:ribosomal protein L7/L12 n=1 Tax=Streptomyces rhizoryzae TaxID=2932493 RepID=UPI0020057DB8|nr:ribosomal protein L7/L12 [Streptomyces rhizoryzae]MCK7623961.1 ribosomal protein L7/L12 [Streptomyces rhizoryzae]